MFAAADFNLSGIEIHDFYEGKTQTLMEKNMRGELNRINDHLKYNRYKDDVNPELWKRLAEIRDDWQTNRVDDADLLKVAECIGDMAVFLDYKEMERESLAIFHSARMQEINEAEKIARCEEMGKKYGPLIWREQYADWCRRRCIHLFAGLVQKRVAELPSGEKFIAEFSERSRITPGESNLLFSVTHKSDGSCCIEAWTDEVMRKDRKFKDKRNAAEAEVNLRLEGGL